MIRTIVYVDGLNLYYRALQGSTGHKWLNLAALAQAVLPDTHEVVGINYYTTRVSGRTDAKAPARQQAYLKALSSLPGVAIHYGKFFVQKKWAGLIQPPEFRPECALEAGAAPQVARVWKTEEKGSDVALGVHLVRDAFKGSFDEAAVLTNDTDLIEPLRIVTQEVGLPITLLTPVNVPSSGLVVVTTRVRHIGPYIGPCQFPNPVQLASGKTVMKPASW